MTLPLDQTPTLPTASIDTPSVPVPIDNIFLFNSSLCGLQLQQYKIVGGRVTELGELSWIVALKYKKDDGSPGGFRCSGSLINDRYVLTAAQCLAIPGYNLTEIRLGEWRLSTEKDCVETIYENICADPVVDLVIKDKILHPFYSKKSGSNNIALLRVAETIKFTEYVLPICLSFEELSPPPAGTRMLVSGWGFTEEGIRSDIKLKLDIPTVGNEECAKAHPSYNNIHACAGVEEGEDACNGDSGGPLMRWYTKQDDVRCFQEGIIYRGFGCGRKGVPSLYTRVSRYTNWIRRQLEL